jgi:hypothetical protein
MNLNTIKNNILKVLSGTSDEVTDRNDNLTATDPDYLTNSPRAVGYESTQEQIFYFQNLLIGYNPMLDTVLDVGAGRGDLYRFICDFYETDTVDYFGIERNPLLCEIAKSKHGIELKNALFEQVEFPQKDWVVAAGVFFNRVQEHEDADFQRIIHLIDKMYQSANVAVSFNLLSPINNDIDPSLLYIHPGLMLDIMIEKYRYVTVKHNYSNTVYTVTIYKM